MVQYVARGLAACKGKPSARGVAGCLRLLRVLFGERTAVVLPPSGFSASTFALAMQRPPRLSADCIASLSRDRVHLHNQPELYFEGQPRELPPAPELRSRNTVHGILRQKALSGALR